ncbi:ABC transporter ATP-binding protein [Staphylococcus gallinarum]|uniref:ABC transporter ATP-binding protein n=1 Tax=Staphylococcus gallinarum TaxID=1293 RepID=A0A3A0VG56_STAGA|nr:ATP-binding cassette domain-containing protein [Staphylococcus gallinarum]RIP32774.1 ABC transporter ATP-binding protein [Staphylococcus gallinarum]
MDYAIKANKISKQYNKKRIINNLSFTIPKNSITLIKGQNGVGKSITLKLLANLISPSQGKINRTSTLSYTPDAFPKNIKLSVDAYLNYIFQFHNTKSNPLNRKYLESLIEQFNLSSFLNTPLTELSKGSLQKVNIIQCLLNNAEILIFDEPFSGLDYTTEHAFINYLSELSTDKTIILTAHNHIIENSIVTHVLNLNTNQFATVQNNQNLELKQILIPNKKNEFPKDIQQYIYDLVQDNDNVSAIKVLKTNSNHLIKSLIDHNYEIIEVKDL